MGMHGEVEITALAVADGAGKEVCARDPDGRATVVRGGGFVFVGGCDGAADAATGEPVAALAGDIRARSTTRWRSWRRGSAPAPPISPAPCAWSAICATSTPKGLFRERARAAFASGPPALIVAGAELGGIDEVRLNAIAV